MRNFPFPLAAVLFLLTAFSSQAAEKPRPAPGNQNQPKKVWTNEDMDQLRARGLISIVGPEFSEAAQPAPAEAEAAPSYPVYQSRLDDPEWYAEQAADLQAELDRRMADLQQEQDALALVKDRITQPGLALDKPSVGVTPSAALAILQEQVQEVQNQLDELSDLARQHDIPPGVLRG
ncbi:MAG TPA: hypothetical protein VGT24_02480 [Candidatus Acidoferrales bacterium]|nr:hypothetical protein [Candidatus Acidoferrales bacterium]